MIQTVSVEIGGKQLTLETGNLAKQANGAVVVRCEDTVVLVTAVAAKQAPQSIDFSVNGRISGKSVCRRKDSGWVY